MKQDTPTVPYVQARYQGKRQRPSAIVLRASHTTSENGAALGLANNWHQHNAPSEPSHFTVDELQIIQCIAPRTIAGQTHTDKGAIRVTICTEPLENEKYWDDAIRSKALDLTAHLVADLAVTFGIRVRYLDYDAAKKWSRFPLKSRGGIIVDIPGTWPSVAFLADVKQKVAQRKR